MKKIYMLSALLCASVFSFTGCVEESFERPVPANDGDEIIFGARAGFEGASSDTKTVYTAEFYTVGDKKFERIDWLDGKDEIQIFCPQAEGPNPSNYTINHSKDHDTQKDYAYLTKKGDSSLQWNGTGDHHFYAMYPAQSLFEGMETTLQQGIKMDGTTLRGIVPASQPATVTQNGLDWVAAPDMKYAYMAAKNTAKTTDGSVSLSFVPIVTAVQIQMVLSSNSANNVIIGEIQISGNGIAGAFSADLSDDGWPSDQTYPTCTNDVTGTDLITISTWLDSKPVTVEPGGSLTFTVFLRPGADYKNLNVRFSPTGGQFVGKTMGSDTNPVNIPRNLKTVVKGFNLPSTEITYDASNWMTAVSDNIQFKKLSLPGTGGSFSYNFNGNDADFFRSQSTDMTIPEQWKVGIRAFEIISDRPSSASTALTNQDVTCNKSSVGIKVGAAVNLINEQLNNNPDECAVLIFTYQPEGNSPARNATSYASSLAEWYDNLTYKDKFVLYTPDITMGDVRGKILAIVRLNQRNESESGSFSGAKTEIGTRPFLLVDGCGTAKDKWGARGYTITTNGSTIVAPDISNGASTYVEQYMQSDYIDPETHANVKRGDMNFGYETNVEGVTCWYQEWARVVPQQLYIARGSWGWLATYPATYWFESYTEKLANAVDTFTKAINDTGASFVYVNTLSGYMATDATKGSPTYSLVPSVGSAYGGDGGDIAALATKLNADFYKEVLAAGMEQTTGPTGIIMMDYVTNAPDSAVEYDGSYYLPGVIIANNFKYGNGNSGSTQNPGNSGNNTQQPGQGDNQQPGSGEEEEG